MGCEIHECTKCAAMSCLSRTYVALEADDRCRALHGAGLGFDPSATAGHRGRGDTAIRPVRDADAQGRAISVVAAARSVLRCLTPDRITIHGICQRRLKSVLYLYV